MKTKLTTRDLIAAGAFGAIYLVLITVMASVLAVVPILFLAIPLIAGIVLGTVYMLYAVKVPKKGAILILCLLVGLITSMATIYPLLLSILWGLLAEVIAAGKNRSGGAIAASYVIFNMTSIGPFYAIIIAKDAFLESCEIYYGSDYVAAMDALTPDWFIVVLIALALLGGLLGGRIGKRILKKHFEKAGAAA